MAFICETCVFIYIGITITTLELTFDFRLFIWVVIFCLLGRALNVFPLMFIINKISKKNKVGKGVQIMQWWAGLRGAIAFSLALGVDSVYSAQMRTVTLVLVHFTIYFMGCGTLPLMQVLKVKSATTNQALDNISKVPTKSEKGHRQRTLRFYNGLDDRFFKVWFRCKVLPVTRDAVEVFERLVSNSNEQEMRERDEFIDRPSREFEDEDNKDEDAAEIEPDRTFNVVPVRVIGQPTPSGNGMDMSGYEMPPDSASEMESDSDYESTEPIKSRGLGINSEKEPLSWEEDQRAAAAAADAAWKSASEKVAAIFEHDNGPRAGAPEYPNGGASAAILSEESLFGGEEENADVASSLTKNVS